MGTRTLNIHERFLRHIWSRQYIEHATLSTTDRQKIRVIDVGTLNLDGGPDFRDAIVRIGATTYHGDVEIHRTVAGWHQHGHFNDPRYNKVILHVVLEQGPDPSPTFVFSGRHIPVLVLEPFLGDSIRTLWQKTILDERSLRNKTIRCSGLNDSVDPGLLSAWLRRLAVERLELKLRRFDERLRELAQIYCFAVHDAAGRQARWRVQGNSDDVPPPHRELSRKDLAHREFWDQLLYEGLMECLGFSKNQESFLRLARSVTLREVLAQHIETNDEALQALLLGAAGLLPRLKTVRQKDSREFVRRLAAEWKECKKFYRGVVLHSADWQLFPTRPVNFPTLRIAAAVRLIQSILSDDLFRRLVEVLKSPAEHPARVRAIRMLLFVKPLPYWSSHYRFDHPTTKLVHPLGPERTNAAITNAIIPLALLYARIFKDRLVREGALHLFESMPPAAENSTTRLMENQLVRNHIGAASVSTQQGLIQLYKFYCGDERCAECDVGRVVFGDGARHA